MGSGQRRVKLGVYWTGANDHALQYYIMMIVTSYSSGMGVFYIVNEVLHMNTYVGVVGELFGKGPE